MVLMEMLAVCWCCGGSEGFGSFGVGDGGEAEGGDGVGGDGINSDGYCVGAGVGCVADGGDHGVGIYQYLPPILYLSQIYNISCLAHRHHKI